MRRYIFLLTALIISAVLFLGCGAGSVTNNNDDQRVIVLTPENSIIVVDDRNLTVRPGLVDPPHAAGPTDVLSARIMGIDGVPADWFGGLTLEYTEATWATTPYQGANGYLWREGIEFGFIAENKSFFPLRAEWEVSQVEPWEIPEMSLGSILVSPRTRTKISLAGPLAARVGAKWHLEVSGPGASMLSRDIEVPRPEGPFPVFWETVGSDDEVIVGVRNEGTDPWIGNFSYRSEFAEMRALVDGEWLGIPESIILDTTSYEGWLWGASPGLPAEGGNWKIIYSLRAFWPGAEDVDWDSHPEPEFTLLPPDPPEE